MAQFPQRPGRSGKDLGSYLRERAEVDRLKGGHATDELSDKCQKLEEELEELKAKYEMYFLGIERLEPVRQREDVKRKIARMKTVFTRNTGLRFRIQTLHARFISYERLWLRAGREKEEGTYHRDLFKARRHAPGARPPELPGKAKPKSAAESEDLDLSDWGGASHDEAPQAPIPATARTPSPSVSSAPAARTPAPAAPAKSPPTPAAKPRPMASPATPAGGVGEAQMREIYASYVAAKRSCNEDVSRLTYEAVAKSVAKQVPELLSRHKAKSVEFKVIVKGGKAILKAVPKI